MIDDAATGRLLGEVFPGTRIAEPAYLRWLYRDSPVGPVVESNVDDEDGRAAHYALVPRSFTTLDGEIIVGLSLNTAVAERARGGGVFRRLAEETIVTARQRGYSAVIGVANANSTPGFVRRLGFTLIGPLPARVLVPRPGRGPRFAVIGATDLAGDVEVARILERASRPQESAEPRWTAETLAWRLSSPGSSYALHRAPGILAVSSCEHRAGINVAVLLALFADHEVGRGEVDALVRSACLLHRAPIALHAGLHARADIRGLPLPRRLRPSPLNLIFRWLDDCHDTTPNIGRFEFLDFDAY